MDIAVEAAQKAFETTWGLNASGSVRSNLLWKLTELMERDLDELAALEAMDNGTLILCFPSNQSKLMKFRQNVLLGLYS